MTNISQRASLRLPIKMKVRITTDNLCTRHLVTQNFSDGGIFVNDPELAQEPVGSIVQVQSDEGIESAPILKARIAWTNNHGAGLEYLLEDNNKS